MEEMLVYMAFLVVTIVFATIHAIYDEKQNIEKPETWAKVVVGSIAVTCIYIASGIINGDMPHTVVFTLAITAGLSVDSILRKLLWRYRKTSTMDAPDPT